MNVLLLSDDGIDAVGLQVLQHAARLKFGQSTKIVSITTAKPKAGQSFSISMSNGVRGQPYVNYHQVAPDVFLVEGTSMDCLYLAMLWPESLLGGGVFDVLLTGVNHGHNVGMDVLHSGTVTAAMMAASYFGLASVAFSQEIPPHEEIHDPESVNHLDYYQNSARFVPKVLEQHPLSAGTCLNVNFPMGSPKGYRRATVALCSRWLGSQQINPNGRDDITALSEGWITMTNLELSLTPTSPY